LSSFADTGVDILSTKEYNFSVNPPAFVFNHIACCAAIDIQMKIRVNGNESSLIFRLVSETRAGSAGE